MAAAYSDSPEASAAETVRRAASFPSETSPLLQRYGGQDQANGNGSSMARPLLRATSATLTGGAIILGSSPRIRTPQTPQPAADQSPRDGAPLQRPSVALDPVQQRMVEAVQDFLWRALPVLVPLILLCLVVFLVAIFLLVRAVIAAIHYHALPCDQPLKWYMVLTLGWSQVPQLLTRITRASFQMSFTTNIIFNVLLCIPTYALLGWGIYMVNASQTCPTTNPGLFYPTRDYIYAQGAMVLLCLLMLLLSCAGMRRILLLLNQLLGGVGCKQAVHALPKIPHDSQELIDLEDGMVCDCPICQDSFGQADKTVVRTPCGHLFHEECLALWCVSHLDCPLCRQQVGEPDPKSED